jgi:polyphosphate kinase
MLIKETPVDNKTGMSATEQVVAVLKQTRKLISKKDSVYRGCVKKLAKHNIRRLDMGSLSKQDEEYIKNYYIKEIYPLLSPQIIDNRHPFPFLINKGIYIGVYFESHHDTSFGIIPAVGAFERMVMLPGGGLRFVLAEDIIYHYADMMFSTHKLLDKMIFRVTRNADIITNESMYDEETDFRFTMKELLKKRVKLAPVRLEIHGELKKEFIRYICKKLSLEPSHVFSRQPARSFLVPRLEEKIPYAHRAGSCSSRCCRRFAEVKNTRS